MDHNCSVHAIERVRQGRCARWALPAAIIILVLFDTGRFTIPLGGPAFGQMPVGIGQDAGIAPPKAGFEITDEAHVRNVYALRRAIIDQAVKIVRQHDEGQLDDERLVRRAAGMLALTNVDRKRSIAEQVKRIDIRQSGPVTEPGPLVGFFVAQTLNERRFPETAEAIIESLRAQRTRQGILVRGFVLGGIDRPEVIRARIKRTLELSADDEGRRLWESNLRDVQKCLAPDYFRNRDNWPSEITSPIHPPDFGERRESSLDPPIVRFPSDKIDVRDNTQMHQFGLLCRAVESNATEILLNRANGVVADDELPLIAANLLKGICVKDATVALCKNIRLRGEFPGEPRDPLDGFPAAQALAASGRTEVADAVIESFRVERRLSPLESLLRAHVLRKLDHPEIILVRIDCYDKTGVGNSFVANLREMKDWFNTPGFFDDKANWPSRMRN